MNALPVDSGGKDEIDRNLGLLDIFQHLIQFSYLKFFSLF